MLAAANTTASGLLGHCWQLTMTYLGQALKVLFTLLTLLAGFTAVLELSDPISPLVESNTTASGVFVRILLSKRHWHAVNRYVPGPVHKDRSVRVRCHHLARSRPDSHRHCEPGRRYVVCETSSTLPTISKLTHVTLLRVPHNSKTCPFSPADNYLQLCASALRLT